MRAGNVHVVGLGEAVAERASAGDEFDVESGPLRDVTACGTSQDIGRCVHTSVVDENIDVARTGLDLLESFFD